MSVAERLALAEQRLAIAEKECDMWKTRAESLESKLTALKKRASEGAEPAAKKISTIKKAEAVLHHKLAKFKEEAEKPAKNAAVVKHCSVCGKIKAECRDPRCQEKIAAKRAAKAN